MFAAPVFELDNQVGIPGIQLHHDLINEFHKFFRAGSRTTQTKIQRVVAQLLVVSANIDNNRHRRLRVHTSTSHIQRKLANGYAKTIPAQVTKS